MKKQSVSPKDEEKFYADALGWDEEVSDRNDVKARIAYIIAGISVSVALMSTFALASVAPLKKTEAYVVMVDKITGQVEVTKPLQQSEIPQDEAITKYFVAKYVTAREGYMRSRAGTDYMVVSKLSSPTVYKRYHHDFDPKNKTSPINIYQDHSTVEIEITNISFLTKNTAYMTIERTEKTRNNNKKHYEAVTLDFQYVLTPSKEKDRFINPLGFEVTQYRVDPQVIQK